MSVSQHANKEFRDMNLVELREEAIFWDGLISHLPIGRSLVAAVEFADECRRWIKIKEHR